MSPIEIVSERIFQSIASKISELLSLTNFLGQPRFLVEVSKSLARKHLLLITFSSTSP